MEKKMVERTLFDLLKPLINLFSLYGFNWKEEPKLARKLLKVTALLYWILIYTGTTLILVKDGYEYHRVGGEAVEQKDPGVTKLAKSIMRILIPANAACFFVCLLKWKSMLSLLNRCKQQYVSPQVLIHCICIRNRLIRPTFVCLIMGLFSYFLREFRDCAYDHTYCFKMTDMVFMFAGTAFVFVNLYIFILMMPLVAAVLCFVAQCVTSTLNERSQELARARTPWRKARSLALLKDRNEELKDLAESANAIGASVMFVVKSTCLILCLLNVYAMHIALTTLFNQTEERNVYHISDGLMHFCVFYPLMMLVVIYFWFLRQHSAVKLTGQLAKVILKSTMLEEDRQLFTSRHPQLLKVRLTHLLYIMEMSMQSNYFLILNEEVTNEDVISVFLDIIDLWNTINAKIPIQNFYNY